MDNKELLKQLKNCIDLCDKLTKEKEELKIELEDQIRVSEELESLLKEANDSIASTVDIISNMATIIIIALLFIFSTYFSLLSYYCLNC